MNRFEKVVSDLMWGKKVRGYSFMSPLDVRELYRVWFEFDNKPEFINGNVKKALDKLGIETVERGIGWVVK